DQVEAMTMGDKIVVMKDGIIQQIGDPLTLYNSPVNRFVAGFIGSPPMNFMTITIVEEGGKLLADEGNFKFALEGKLAEIAKEYVGKQLVFGTRPEDLEFAPNAKDGDCIVSHIEVVEPLGAEIHIYVSTGSHQIIARIPPTAKASVGEEVRLIPDQARAILFDIETEQALNVEVDQFQK
ncbi:MAG: TOBE domain-containing protein, partial [Alkalispirochaeta sp.]